MTYDDIVTRVSEETNISRELVDKVYKAYWYSIKGIIKSLPLMDTEDEDTLNKMRTSFNIPSIGKLGCTLDRIQSIKQKYKENNDKRKEY